MIVAFGHQARVGKDTAADYVVAKYGGVKLAAADPLRAGVAAMQRVLGVAVEKDARLMQIVGRHVRGKYGDDFFARRLVDGIVSQGHGDLFVVSDLRFNVEVAALRAAASARGLRTVFVKITRRNRPPIGRDPADISETELADFEFDATISNDGAVEDLYSAVDVLLSACGQKKNG